VTSSLLAVYCFFPPGPKHLIGPLAFTPPSRKVREFFLLRFRRTPLSPGGSLIKFFVKKIVSLLHFISPTVLKPRFFFFSLYFLNPPFFLPTFSICKDATLPLVLPWNRLPRPGNLLPKPSIPTAQNTPLNTPPPCETQDRYFLPFPKSQRALHNALSKQLHCFEEPAMGNFLILPDNYPHFPSRRPPPSPLRSLYWTNFLLSITSWRSLPPSVFFIIGGFFQG